MTLVRSSTIASGRAPIDPATRFTARPCSPVTITWSSSLGVTPADFSASLIAISASGTYACSPNRSSHTCEASSPGRRQRSRNSFVAAPVPTTSTIARESNIDPENRNATAASPPSRSSAPPGRPVRMSAITASSGTGEVAPMRPAAIDERAEPTTSKADVATGMPSAAWIAVAFVLSRYGGAVVANTSTCGAIPPAAFIAMRAASTPIDVASSSNDATARVPLPPPDPSAAPIAPRCNR